MTSISNLRLRPIRSTDFKIYYRLVSSPQVAKGARFKPANSASQAHRLLKDDLKSFKCLAITLNGTMIGMISLYPTIGTDSAPDYGRLEVADLMLPKHQGHGHMTKAIGILINQLRKTSQVKKLVALVDKDNLASRKVLRKNHFDNYHSVLDFTTGREDLIYQLNLK